MKKIKIPSKLRDLLFKLDRILPTGVALACTAILIVGSLHFRNGLTDVNSDIGALDTLPYYPSDVTEEETQTHSVEEIETVKKEMRKKPLNSTTTEMPFKAGMQPHDPGVLSDLIVVGTYTGHKQYCYESFVADVRIDKVLSPLANTSKLTTRGRKQKSVYKIPSLDLHEGAIIKVYDECVLQTTDDGKKEIAKGSSSNRYSQYSTPLRPGGQYLFFLNYILKDDTATIDTARFRIVPSLYGRIPISNGKTFSPNIFCTNLPTRRTKKDNAAKPLGVNSSEAPDEDFKRRDQEARAKIPKFTYRDATKIDLFVKSPRVEQLYRDTAAKILQKYVN